MATEKATTKAKKRNITIIVSDKIFTDFDKKCKELEVTKSEVLKRYIREFIAEGKGY